MSNPPNTSLQVPKIIWFALTISQVVYGVVGMSISPDSSEGNDILAIGLLVMGLSNAVLSFVVVPKFFKVTSRENALSLFIVQWALIESIAIFGLVGKIMAGSLPLMIGMISMSFIFMLLLFPSEKRWNALIQPK